MIPANRVTIVVDTDDHLEAHVTRARTNGIDVVDRWDSDWNCTCYAAMVLHQARCPHIQVVQEVVQRSAE